MVLLPCRSTGPHPGALSYMQKLCHTPKYDIFTAICHPPTAIFAVTSLTLWRFEVKCWIRHPQPVYPNGNPRNKDSHAFLSYSDA